jgi:hypothetical protein
MTYRGLSKIADPHAMPPPARLRGRGPPEPTWLDRQAQASLVTHQHLIGFECVSVRASCRWVQEALIHLRAARQDLQDVIDPDRGRVALGFAHSRGPRDVPRLLDAFLAASPDISFTLKQCASERDSPHTWLSRVRNTKPFAGLCGRARASPFYRVRHITTQHLGSQGAGRWLNPRRRCLCGPTA